MKESTFIFIYGDVWPDLPFEKIKPIRDILRDKGILRFFLY